MQRPAHVEVEAAGWPRELSRSGSHLNGDPELAGPPRAGTTFGTPPEFDLPNWATFGHLLYAFVTQVKN